MNILELMAPKAAGDDLILFLALSIFGTLAPWSTHCGNQEKTLEALKQYT